MLRACFPQSLRHRHFPLAFPFPALMVASVLPWEQHSFKTGRPARLSRFARGVVRNASSREERFAMQIRHILQQKGCDIVAISPAMTLENAAQVLAEKRIGALVVTEDEEPAGIFYGRDLVRAIAREGAGAVGHAITTYMTKNVATCTEADTVEELM